MPLEHTLGTKGNLMFLFLSAPPAVCVQHTLCTSPTQLTAALPPPPFRLLLCPRYPLNYIWVRQAAPDTYKAGSGSARFWVPNYRKDLYLVYLRYPNEQNALAPKGTFSWASPNVTVLESAKLSPTAGLLSAPHQLRLSIQPTPR